MVAVAASDADVPVVLTQPDRPAGRGRRLSSSPIKQTAERLGFAVAQPETLPKHAEAAAWLPEVRPDLMIVVAYGLLLPRWLLDWPRLGCINVHASLLPRWRGAAPIQHAIMAGDEQTGVSLMRMDVGLDTGPVYASRSTVIAPDDTGGRLHDRLSLLGAALLADTLPRILAGLLEPVPQNAARCTYAPKIDKSAGRLDWSQPAEVLARRVRALDPWPVAFADLSDGRRLRILDAVAHPSSVRADPGRIAAAGRGGIDVVTSAGVLRLLRIQPPSSRVMAAEAYLAAHSLDGVHFV